MAEAILVAAMMSQSRVWDRAPNAQAFYKSEETRWFFLRSKDGILL